MANSKSSKLEAGDPAAREKKIQNEEAQRKQASFQQSVQGMRKSLKDARVRISSIDAQARNCNMSTASWTDARGVLRRSTGAGFSIVDAAGASDLFVRSNQKSVHVIIRKCQRAMQIVDDLVDVLGTEPKAMPLELDAYLERVIGEIPALNTIKMEVTHEPKRPATAGKDMDGQ